MNLKDLKKWSEKLQEINKDNEELIKYLKHLDQLIDNLQFERLFQNIRDVLDTVSQLEKAIEDDKKIGKREKKEINYEELPTATHLLENDFSNAKLYDFMDDIRVNYISKIKIASPPRKPTIEEEIQTIYKDYKKRVEETTKENHPLEEDLFAWHKLFVESIKNKGDKRDDTFVFYSSIWNVGNLVDKPDVERGKEQVIIDYRKYNEEGKPQIKEQANDKKEEIIHYSMVLANKSRQYQLKFESFKEQYIKEEHQEAGKSCANQSLVEIMRLIERTEWTTWHSRKKILNDKAVPNHIYEIYEKAKEGLGNGEQAVKAMKEINQIAKRALNYEPTFFPSQRKRDSQTTEAYEAIQEHSKPGAK